MTDIVTLNINEKVAEITMDDGKANVLSHSMFDQLNETFDIAEKEKAIIILKAVSYTHLTLPTNVQV